MKQVVIIMLALFISAFSVSAQSTKGKPTTEKSDTVAQVNYTCPMHPDVVSDKPGKCPKCNMDLTLSKKEQMKMEVMKMYTCPMHPEVKSDKAGNCPKCGMQLVEKKKAGKTKDKKTGMMSCCM